MQRCTWNDSVTSELDKRCKEEGLHTQLDELSRPWAYLCENHHRILKESYRDSPLNALAYWMQASGGPRVLALALKRDKKLKQ